MLSAEANKLHSIGSKHQLRRRYEAFSIFRLVIKVDKLNLSLRDEDFFQDRSSVNEGQNRSLLIWCHFPMLK